MKFSAKARSVQGSSASRRLRREGRLPGIVYGGKGEPLNIDLDHNEIFHALRKQEFHSSLLEMDLDGKTETVLLRAVQWHPYKPQVLHIDFLRIERGQPITTKIPLHFINDEDSPAVKLHGNLISKIVTEIEVTCLPKDLPSEIVVDLGELEADSVIHLSSIKAPEGVEFTAHGHEEDMVLASASTPRAVTESADPVEGPAPEEAPEEKKEEE